MHIYNAGPILIEAPGRPGELIEAGQYSMYAPDEANFPRQKQWARGAQLSAIRRCITAGRAYMGNIPSRDGPDMVRYDPPGGKRKDPGGGKTVETWMAPDATQRAAPVAKRDNQGNLTWETDESFPCPRPVTTIGGVQQWAVDAILGWALLTPELVGTDKPAGIHFRVSWTG